MNDPLPSPIGDTGLSGAVIVVWRGRGEETRFLILHRAASGPDSSGEWAWGPPSGCREPGESSAECAARELLEETGLDLPLTPVGDPAVRWPLFLAEAAPDAIVRLSFEHDQHAWLTLDHALALPSPEQVRAQLRAAARCLGPAFRAQPG